MSSPHIRDLISRRALLKGAAATPLLTLAGGGVSLAASGATGPSFTAVRETMADTVTVPKECDWRVLASWGDPLFKDMAPFDPKTLTRAEQERRFGNNNDFVALFPAQYAFPWETDSDRLLMCVNHESSDVHLMYADLKTRRDTTPAQRQVALAAVGISVVEIERGRDGWRVRTGAPLNRRLTPFSPVLFAGPAAQHPWIETASAVVNRVEPPIADAPADSVRCGTLANCSGGRTPWGTYLSSEENLDGFYGLTDENAPLVAAARNDTALVYDAGRYGYPLYEKSNLPSAPAQFDMAHNPYGPSLYGWVVEVDPYDVNWTPRKRTALGRKKGECATTALTKDGRVAVYMGDDQVNHFVFKFVSRDQFNPADRKANRDLLDHGALYAARFDENGGGEWVELSVAACNRAVQDAPYHARFKDQGDVLMRAREAAVLLGATPMDRPEDVEAPVDAQWRGQGVALVVCTMNRTEDYGRPGNPRRGEAESEHLQQMNVGGHILRIDEDDADNGATRFHWGVFALCGDPDADPKFTMPGGVAANVSVDVRGKPTMSGDRFVCPDNICFDGAGNVWIATDGLNEVFPSNDCVVVTPLNGGAPRPVKRFLVGPIGAEICGPALTPDERAFFCAIQHPGENDLKGTAIADLKTAGLGPGSHFPRGGASWPLSSVVIVSRKDGKKIWA